MGIAHFAFDLGPRGQRGNRIHHDQIDRSAPHQRLCNLERLFPGIRLRHQQIIRLHPELLGIGQVKRMFRIDKCRHPAGFLHLRNTMERHRRLTGRFRTEDFDHPTARQSPDTERDVSAEQLAALRHNPHAFLFELNRQDGMVLTASGREIPRLPSRVFC